MRVGRWLPLAFLLAGSNGMSAEPLPYRPVVADAAPITPPTAVPSPESGAALRAIHQPPPAPVRQAPPTPAAPSRNWLSALLTGVLAVVLSVVVLAVMLVVWTVYRAKQRAWHRQLYATDYLRRSSRLRGGRRHDVHV